MTTLSQELVEELTNLKKQSTTLQQHSIQTLSLISTLDEEEINLTNVLGEEHSLSTKLDAIIRNTILASNISKLSLSVLSISMTSTINTINHSMKELEDTIIKMNKGGANY